MEQQPQQAHPETPKGTSIIQLAMQSGWRVGIFFILQAVSFLLFRWGFLSSLLFMAGFLMVPISLVLLTIQYRDNVRGGQLRYIDVVGYMMWTYLFALIIGVVVYYLCVRYLLSNPTFIANLEQSIEILSQLMADKASEELLQNSVMGLTARTFTISFMTSALFLGIIFIYIAGIFIKRPYGKK